MKNNSFLITIFIITFVSTLVGIFNIMLTPNNAVEYSNPSGFDCGTPDQQAAFLTFHEITKTQFDAVVGWFNGPNPKPAPFIVSGVDMDNLISNADCKTEAVVIFGDITTLGQTGMSIDLMTYTDINNNTPVNLIGIYGLYLFKGLINHKNADSFHFYKGTYNYTTNPNQKLESAIFVAYANQESVYYGEFSANNF